MPEGFRQDRHIDVWRGTGFVGNGDIDAILGELKLIAVVGSLAAWLMEKLPADVGLVKKAGCSLGGFFLLRKVRFGAVPVGIPRHEQTQVKGINAAGKELEISGRWVLRMACYRRRHAGRDARFC